MKHKSLKIKSKYYVILEACLFVVALIVLVVAVEPTQLSLLLKDHYTSCVANAAEHSFTCPSTQQ